MPVRSGALGRAAAWLASLAALLGCAESQQPARHLVLISLDTTRADHIGVYGSRARTPAIDAFAAEGVVFENASAAGTTTLPSHVSLMTGAWPIHHGVPANGFTVNPANVMLAEMLRQMGFRTVGVSAALELSDLLGFHQGFQVWDQDEESYAGHVVANRDARRAEAITDAAIARLDEAEAERLFLFVHYVDPHVPYDPPEPFRSMYGAVPDDLHADFAAVLEARREHHARAGHGLVEHRLTPEIVRGTPREPLGLDRDLARLYAGEVSYMDHHLGRLFEALRQRGLYDEALIVLTADHGETFWEHGDVWSHGLSVYETTVRMPLVLRLPGGAHAGARIEAVVSNVDVVPTVLEQLGFLAKGRLDGVSLMPLLRGEEPARRAVYSQGAGPGRGAELGVVKWLNERKPHSIRMGRWKLLRTPYLELEELYDLERDPDEQRDLLPDGGEAAAERAATLGEELGRWMASAQPLPSAFFPRLPASGEEDEARRRAMLERLRQLGYVE